MPGYICDRSICYAGLISNFFHLNHVFSVFSMEIKSQNSQKVYSKDCFPYSYCKYLVVSDPMNQALYFSQCTSHGFMETSKRLNPK